MKKGIGLLAVGLALVLGGCAGMELSPTLPGARPQPTTTPYSLLVRAPGAITWERSGGIAGLCQQLVIQTDGSYVLDDTCRSTGSRTGHLTQDESDQLRTWLETYQAFDWSTPDQPGSADMFSVKLRFRGAGSAHASPAIQSMIEMTIGQWASGLEVPATVEPAPSSGQGIEGKAVLGPSCPVARAEDPCPDRPYQATFEVLDRQGRRVTEFTTESDGTFQVSLPAGTYTISGVTTGAFPLPPTVEVAVQPGQYTQVSLTFDSGIR